MEKANNISILNLSNGLRIGVDKMKEVDTVSIVLGVKTGSRNETKENNGISHFLEHMAFKGTEKRNYLEIAEAIDNVGGYINASTSKEKTLYYVKLMKEDLELGIELLSDIFQNSIFPEKEIEKERGVILQELSATLDTPDDIVFDYFYEKVFEDSKLGMQIIGTADNIKRFQKVDFEEYISNQYSAKNTVLSVCGNVDEDVVLKLGEKYLSGLKNIDVKIPDSAKYSGGDYIKNKKDLEQVQCVIGFPSLDYHTNEIYKVSVMSNILGGGMSSRLFQEIREKRGLVYTVSCWNDSYSDTGVFTIYGGTSPEKVDEFLLSVKDEAFKITKDITDIEMNRVLKQVKAGIIMGKESTTGRAKKCCSDILSFDRYIEYKEVIDEISKITKDDIKNMAEKIFFSSKPTLVLYGNMTDIKTKYKEYSEFFQK